MRGGVFLDRDGVITEDVYYPETGEWEAPMRPEDVALRAGAVAGLARLKALGLPLILVSNQGAYAKGKTTLAALWACTCAWSSYWPRTVSGSMTASIPTLIPTAACRMSAARRSSASRARISCWWRPRAMISTSRSRG